MSWKSLVSAGLLCLLAVPAWAVPAVSFDLVRGPDDPGPIVPVVLDSNGDFQWLVRITPDATAAAAGDGTMGAELAFLIGGSGLVSASNANAAQWDNSNPGERPTFGSGFAWATPASPDQPEGLQSNTTTDEVFASLGSINFTDGNTTDYILIKTLGPSITGDLDTPQATPLNLRTTSVQLGGAYAGNTGLLAQDLAGDDNDRTFVSGSQTFSVVVGDANINGVVDLADFVALINNFGLTGGWAQGNFNNTKNPLNTGTTATTTDLADFVNLINNFGGTTPGSGGLAIPEPASVALMMTALSLVAAIRRR